MIRHHVVRLRALLLRAWSDERVVDHRRKLKCFLYGHVTAWNFSLRDNLWIPWCKRCGLYPIDKPDANPYK